MLSDRRVHAIIPTGDLDAARTFYEGVLGFVPLQAIPAAVMYGAGDGSLFAVSRSSGRASGTHTQLAFTTPDIETDMAELRARGVTFEDYDSPALTTVDGIGLIGPNRAAWFKDPEGNILALIQFDAGAGDG